MAKYSWQFDFSEYPQRGRYSFNVSHGRDFDPTAMMFMIVPLVTAKLLYTHSRDELTSYVLVHYGEYVAPLVQAHTLNEAINAVESYPEPINVDRIELVNNHRGVVPFEVVIAGKRSFPEVSRILGADVTFFDWLSTMRVIIRDLLKLSGEHPDSNIITDMQNAKLMGVTLNEILKLYSSQPTLYRSPRSIREVPMHVITTIGEFMTQPRGA